MDTRVNLIFEREMKNDRSFQNDGNSSFFGRLFGLNKTDRKLRDIWHLGIKYGIEIGLRRASVEGQKKELTHNTAPEDRAILEEIFDVMNKHNCAIQYHPDHGQMIIRRRYDRAEHTIKNYI